MGMTPQRLQHVPIDTVAAALTAATLSSVVLELVAPANLILVVLFVVAVLVNFLAGVLRSFALHRRGGEDGKWFSASRATFGVIKKFALALFIPLAGVVDGTFMVAEATRAVAELTPITKGVLAGLIGAQVIGAARSLHYVVGDDAIPALAVLLRAIDRAHAGGEPPHRRVTDPVIDAYADADAANPDDAA